MSDATRFAADAMLGRLARWLRVLGYDTWYDIGVADPVLVELARAEVMAAEAAAPFLPEGVRGLPGPVRRCPECGRLYWNGSHVRRMRDALERALPGWVGSS